MTATCRIGIGSAQWGFEYGATNRQGRPGDAEIAQMLDIAAASGIDTIDTAAVYGDAEAVIGRLDAVGRGFRIVTKTSVGGAGVSKLGDVRDEFQQSLAKLRCKMVDTLLVHSGTRLLEADGKEVWGVLEGLRDAGQIRHLGVSVYSPAELERLLDLFPLEVVQLPYNIYDQRFATAGLLDRLRQQNIEIHARSALLQGILLVAPGKLPPHFHSIAEHQRLLHVRIAAIGMTPLQAALRYCLGDPRISRVIVGCETADQLAEIVTAKNGDADACKDLSRFAVDDENITLPTRWPAVRLH